MNLMSSQKAFEYIFLLRKIKEKNPWDWKKKCFIDRSLLIGRKQTVGIKDRLHSDEGAAMEFLKNQCWKWIYWITITETPSLTWKINQQ